MHKAKSLAAVLILFILAACSAPTAGLLSAPGPLPSATATATAYRSVTPTGTVDLSATPTATATAYLSVTPTPYAGTPAPTDTVTVTPLAAGEVLPTSVPGGITVMGEAVMKVAPDTVVLTLGVETLDSALPTAKANNDVIVKKVLALATAAGVDAKDVQTDYVSIEPRYDDASSKRTLLGYYVRKDVAITLRDLTKFDSLLSDCLGAGVNYVHGVTFSTSMLQIYREQARQMAIQAARTKAAEMARDLGRSVGDATKLTEERSNLYSGYNSYWGGSYNAASQNVMQDAGSAPTIEGALAPGMISVTADVTVEFELK